MSSLSKRVIIPFSEGDLELIDEYQHELRIRSRAAAIRRLIHQGAAHKQLGDLPNLAGAIQVLRENQSDLRRMGVHHAAVFGSVARGSVDHGSDTDILIEFKEHCLPDVFAYTGVCRRIQELLPGADVVERGSLKKEIAARVASDAVYAF